MLAPATQQDQLGTLVAVLKGWTGWLRNAGLSAITAVERANSGDVTFNPATGVPVVVYFCDLCGYIEMYAAQKTPYWELEKKQP
jgi:hypothetical protein